MLEFHIKSPERHGATAIIPNDPGNRFSICLSCSRSVVYTYARHGVYRGTLRDPLSRRLRAGKNTRRVYAVKKHGGSLGAGSFTKLIDANDALIVLPPRRRCRLAFYYALEPALENFGTSNEIQLELPDTSIRLAAPNNRAEV